MSTVSSEIRQNIYSCVNEPAFEFVERCCIKTFCKADDFRFGTRQLCKSLSIQLYLSFLTRSIHYSKDKFQQMHRMHIFLLACCWSLKSCFEYLEYVHLKGGREAENHL